MSFGDFVALVDIIGILVYLLFVARIRAGITLSGSGDFDFAMRNLSWVTLTVAKSVVWWAVLLYWLYQGRPPSPWKAVEGRGGHLLIRRVKPSDETKKDVATT